MAKRGLKWPGLFILLIVVHAACAAKPALAQTHSNNIYDFMVMDVCVDSSNNVLGNLTPADPQCIHRRNINPGEPVPYHLHNFDTGCDPDVGTVSKDNIPVVKNGITRVVSYYDHDIKGSCRKAPADRQSDAQQDGGSVQWYDA